MPAILGVCFNFIAVFLLFQKSGEVSSGLNSKRVTSKPADVTPQPLFAKVKLRPVQHNLYPTRDDGVKAEETNHTASSLNTDKNKNQSSVPKSYPGSAEVSPRSSEVSPRSNEVSPRSNEVAPKLMQIETNSSGSSNSRGSADTAADIVTTGGVSHSQVGSGGSTDGQTDSVKSLLTKFSSYSSSQHPAASQAQQRPLVVADSRKPNQAPVRSGVGSLDEKSSLHLDTSDASHKTSIAHPISERTETKNDYPKVVKSGSNSPPNLSDSRSNNGTQPLGKSFDDSNEVKTSPRLADIPTSNSKEQLLEEKTKNDSNQNKGGMKKKVPSLPSEPIDMGRPAVKAEVMSARQPYVKTGSQSVPPSASPSTLPSDTQLQKKKSVYDIPPPATKSIRAITPSTSKSVHNTQPPTQSSATATPSKIINGSSFRVSMPMLIANLRIDGHVSFQLMAFRMC